jgi:hypothetical protein
MDQKVNAQTYTAVQAVRWEARNIARDAGVAMDEKSDETKEIARDARKILMGRVGLSAVKQVANLTAAAASYVEAAKAAGTIGKDDARKLYSEAAVVCEKGVAIVEGRDYDEYQATKHQGAAGWTVHMKDVHGIDVATDQAETVEFNAVVHGETYSTTEEIVAEMAYQIHKGLEAHTH